ncbi:hypothetical protein C5167_020023 [Papaver somniferum]|uniref:Uncharacterized protein n=1 Tax=Papaver somniferum TaxID=3469 RepID=A0A4Y7IRU0_PAPSO|nr:inorganic pyrophosphatase 1-like [Papaver somniferum]RZC51594.1 hypothetical protein C5167_020023 [Papaver somniferum]
MAGVVVVFDFDRTLIDKDSDRWVIDHFGVTTLYTQLYPTMPWNSLVDRMIQEIHSQGRTIEEISECLKGVPLHPNIITAIKSAHNLGCDLRIVSDANMFFIETILMHHGIMECFSEINTNPIKIDEQRRLRVFPYHDASSAPHGCTLTCPPHMCKGKIMERIRNSASFVEGQKQFIYIGDGGGDFCPSVKLKEEDYVMPRKDYPVCKMICKNKSLMKAEIHEWSTGDELEVKLLGLINKISGCQTTLKK